MKKSRTNLKEALERNNGQVPLSEPEKVESVDPSQNKSQVSPSRQGKKPVIAYFDKKTHHQLKLLALEKETSIQNLVAEALNLLFNVHDKPPIAK